MRKNIFMLLLSLFLCGAYVTTNNNAKTTQENDLNKIMDRERKNTTTTFLSNDATYYFSNLTQNFAKNYKGTCTYVATAMLLQYYDTFWDDNIVPAQYEVVSATTEDINARTSSPGIRTDKIPGLTDLQAQQLTNLQYYDYVTNMANDYFQPKLLKTMESIDPMSITMASEACFASLTELGRIELIDYYLQNIVGYSSTAYTLEVYGSDVGSESSTDVRNHIINKIKKGIPVLMCVEVSGSSHACIAYDYDYASGYIYTHWGDLEPDTHYGLMSGGTVVYKSAMTLSFHNSHTHTDNYKKIVNGNVYSYCGCHLSTHRHVAHTFAQLNGEYHIEYCYCGNYSRQDLHTCYGDSGRYEPCSECGTIVDLWNVGTNAIIREEQPEVA